MPEPLTKPVVLPGKRPASQLVALNECQGKCMDHGGHRGTCELVRVFDATGKDWGVFSYCRSARIIDRNNGLTVRLEEPMLENLTKRQQEVLEFIKSKIETNGCPPTVREIGAKFGISSPNGVRCHLDALESKGWITRDANKARSIRLVESGPSLRDAAERMLRIVELVYPPDVLPANEDSSEMVLARDELRKVLGG